MHKPLSSLPGRQIYPVNDSQWHSFSLSASQIHVKTGKKNRKFLRKTLTYFYLSVIIELEESNFVYFKSQGVNP